MHGLVSAEGLRLIPLPAQLLLIIVDRARRVEMVNIAIEVAVV